MCRDSKYAGYQRFWASNRSQWRNRTGDFDAVLIATDHDAMDYAALSGLGLPIIDTRNAMARRGLSMTNVTKA
jgi:UDP-N-acetyl-D-mannosaminuronate dehydrogenase